MIKRAALALVPAILFLLLARSQGEIIFNKRDAVVWSQSQRITGRLSGFTASAGQLYVNAIPLPLEFAAGDSTFAIDVRLSRGVNTLMVTADSSGRPVSSGMLRLTLGFTPRPELFAWASVSGGAIRLHSRLLEEGGDPLQSWNWQADEGNPGAAAVAAPGDSATAVTIAAEAPYGEYYFDLTAVSAVGDTGMARTLITLDARGVRAFDMASSHAAWIDNAVLYEITPASFVENGRLNDITGKIPELASLGITALWLQPTFGTLDYGGMGYGITDYFAVRSDLGNEADLHTLVRTAHSFGLKVLLDMVPNHTYIEHPYALDAVRYGEASHYYQYYQHDAQSDPAIPYSQHYHTHPLGLVYYFWDLLPNLDYDNPEVRQWMTEICSWWIREFDIDGYRFDAVWGVNARHPQFARDLRLALKRIKPEILMLAEDKATSAAVYAGRFDAAFDWTADQSWVSQWSWQVLYQDYWEDQNSTIFNSWLPGRGLRLHNALTNNGAGFAPDAIILRFLENNDTQRFARHHAPEVVRMASALEFSLPGIPLLYNGQEIGFAGRHPYYGDPIFRRGASIQSLDKAGYFSWYQQLVRLRRELPALHGPHFAELPVRPSSWLYAFHRWNEDQNIFVVVNMGSRSENLSVDLPIAQLALDSTRIWYLTELLSGAVISGRANELRTVNLAVDKYTTRLFLLADSIAATGVAAGERHAGLPEALALQQNYPNPFNPQTTIRFSLPHDGPVRLRIYNLLGELAATPLDEYRRAGEQEVHFDAYGLASGLYLCRLEFAGESRVRKMIIAR